MATLSSLTTSAGGALRLLDRRVYTANGTWTKPADNAGNILAGVGKIVRARAIGGGGGGLYFYYAAYAIDVSSGGSGGGTSEADFDISQIAASVTITVGVGGTGVTTGAWGDSANSGGNSSFGGYVWAEGGRGGRSIVASYATAVNTAAANSMADGTNTAVRMLGGSGTTFCGNRGAYNIAIYNNSSGTYYNMNVGPERGPGCGGGGTTITNVDGSAGPSGSVPVGSNSTTEGPGPGGKTTVGGLYGGGGGASFAAYTGGQGIVVVETWG